MSVPVERWVADGAAVVVPDPAAHVPDRRAFAAAHCRRANRVTLDADPVAGDADDAEDVDHARDADHADDASDPDRVADGVLFLAPDPDPTPPRVVATLVGPRGRRPVGPDAARVAAAWTARRTGADAVMVDTARGTRRATVDGDVTLERDGDLEGDATAEREVAVEPEGAIGNEVAVEAPRPAVRVVECDDPSALADDDAMADGGAVASDSAVTDGGRTHDGGGVGDGGRTDDGVVDGSLASDPVEASIRKGPARAERDPHVVAFVRDATDRTVDDRTADENGTPNADGAAGDARPPVLATPSDDGGFRCRVVQEVKDRATTSCEVGAVTHGAATVAVATAAVRTGRADSGDEVSVSTPAGSVVVTVPDAGHALVRGRAKKVGSELLERAVL